MSMLCALLWFMTVLIQSLAKHCTMPELPQFSRPITALRDQYEENTLFKYGCVDKYHLEGPGPQQRKIICSDGHWEPKHLDKCRDACKNTCEHGTCEKTVDPETKLTVATCLCNQNYAGKRCDARVCELLALKPHHLPPIAIPDTIGGGKYSLGTTLTFRCAKNYAFKNGIKQYQSKCKRRGWYPIIPECIENICVVKDLLRGAHTPAKGNYKVGDVVEFSCQSGFTLRGFPSSTCENAGWYPEWPTCVQSDCRPPPMLQHGRIIDSYRSRYKLGTILHFKCDDQYYSDRRNSIKCGLYLGKANWDHTPRCYTVDGCGGGGKIIEKKEDGSLYCVPKGPLITVSSTVKPLTIVTATAGALLLLLLIVISLVAYQRRRIALANRRQDRGPIHNNENDRFSFVYYTNDVHVVLPSYDEAVGVQGAPPPYGGNDATDNTNNGLGGEDAPGTEHNQTHDEVIYEAIDEALHANYIQGQTNESGTSIATSSETSNPSSLNNEGDVFHKEVETDSVSVISLSVDDTDDTVPLI